MYDPERERIEHNHKVNEIALWFMIGCALSLVLVCWN